MAEIRNMKTADINADEIRAIVAKMREEGRITDAKPKYRTPPINPALTEIACDQCGTRFMKQSPTQQRCSKECARKANNEAVRRWHVERGLRSEQRLSKRHCKRCRQEFDASSPNHTYCSQECRYFSKPEPRNKHGNTKR